ncbi:MAG: hypothetical protein N0E44_19070 [Candidatus Thiodiazotropha lotti]|nr:hypothetical protein [Candidatus Thiodiazotropha lotti]MCW4221988.1 hypothetical protein [Candidatus Thiodiazotropha lotti]
MTEVIQLSDFRCGVVRQKSKPTKKNTTRPQNAISKADKAELDERIKAITRRFKYPGLAKQHITHDIRKSCGVGRYYHITPSQMTSYIEELDSKEYKAYVFARLRYVLSSWDDSNLETVFIDCDFDIDRFIDRVVE